MFERAHRFLDHLAGVCVCLSVFFFVCGVALSVNVVVEDQHDSTVKHGYWPSHSGKLLCQHALKNIGRASHQVVNDNEHSSSQLSVHKALACPEGQGSWALAHSLFGEVFPSMCTTCPTLVPLEMSGPVSALEMEM